MTRPPLTFLEFFAGGGMARQGLGPAWRCLFANDFDPGKAKAYRANWGDDDFRLGDVWALKADDLPGRADLAWASSPCQDFSLAGARAGLAGGRSSAFWGFWRLIEALDDQGRAPRVLVLENVGGILSSHGGADFATVCDALSGRGYRFGAVEVDARAFTPQSRPRVFIIAARALPSDAPIGGPGSFHTRAVRQAFDALPEALRRCWLWWRLPAPAARNVRLADVLEPDHQVRWRTPAQTEALLGQLSPAHAAQWRQALNGDERMVAAVFRRIRQIDGAKTQRAELRLDGLAGCLRTPRGGSSRQLLLIGEGGRTRSRLLNAREGARLMGLPDDFRLPASETAAMRVIGDGVAAPVVRFLGQHVLEPLLAGQEVSAAAE
ncbi:MAG TPA: DNA cytosine methyltransferase [Caulobacteraceae bacterium]|jgi:DNA (cytosine-5)-methyltransferase 1|nr:DNA cytosine methyltransferase [Caulobacteraceae bacterium]